jgi:deazaflavin-dependent oxidoreductase (nitroreductase family)
MTNATEASGKTRTGLEFGPMARAGEWLLTRLHNLLYRASGGRMGGTFFKAPVLLLTTTGCKTGKPRTSPLLYLEDGDTLVLVASHAGAVVDPSWCKNLRANPVAEVNIGGTVREVRAEFAGEADRERLWPRLVRMYGSFDSYQARTSRRIPVILLRPA